MSRPSQAVPTFITALGAVTSVGLNIATTCAAIRAGLSRPAELVGHESMDYLGYTQTPTTGHPVRGLARGFSGVGRWLQLAVAAVDDLCVFGNLPPVTDRAFWRATVAYWVLPAITAQRFAGAPHCRADALTQSFVEPLMARVGERFAPARVDVVTSGRTGVFEVMRAQTWQDPTVERVVVVATDSLVDAISLQWLDEYGRLKNDMNPVGLSPAEASVALMLESSRTAKSRGSSAHAILHAVATGVDRQRCDGDGAGGLALAEVTQGVLAQASLGSHGAASSVSDLNGEVWRARELSAAQSRVGHARWDLDRMVLPVVSTGDPGAALSALQFAVAARSLERGYAGGSSVLVTSTERDGSVAAAIVGRA